MPRGHNREMMKDAMHEAKWTLFDVKRLGKGVGRPSNELSDAAKVKTSTKRRKKKTPRSSYA